MSWQRPGRVCLTEGRAVWRPLCGLDLMEVRTLAIKGVLSLVIVTLVTALTAEVLKTFWDIRLLADHSVEIALRQVIVGPLILPAIGEVFKTTLTYFSEGRVRVTFVVDTILVVMLTEGISQWFKGADWPSSVVLGGVLLILGTVRVQAVRWSPTQPARSACILQDGLGDHA